MKSVGHESSDGPTSEELHQAYVHFAAIPIGDQNCEMCGGSGFANYGDSAGRCGCMPPFVVQDRVTGAMRYGNLLIDGRMDGQPVDREEAEHRHQVGADMAAEQYEEMKRRYAGRMRPSANQASRGDNAPAIRGEI